MLGILYQRKLCYFMYKTVYDYFEKEVRRCSYHYTDTDSILINKNVPDVLLMKK